MPSRARLRALAVLGLCVVALLMAGPAPVSGQEADAPGRPTNLTGEVSHDAVTLSWDAPSGSTVTGYQILRRDRSKHAQGNFEIHVDDTGSLGTTYTDSDVEPEARYVYRVKARNGAAIGPQSSYFDANLPAPPVPARPTGLTGTVSHDDVSLIWDDPQDASITSYQILRRDRSKHAQGNFEIHVDDTGSADTSYTDTDVEAGARYVYRIKARNAAGLSPRSGYLDANVPQLPTVTVSFEEATYTVSEGESVVVAVVLDKDPEEEVTIEIVPANQGGAQDADYSGVPQEVVFASAETRKEFTVTAADDSDDDDGESVLLRFGAGLPAGVRAGATNEAEVFIADNDVAERTDCSAGHTTHCALEVGHSAYGFISSSADDDRWKIDFSADTAYRIEVRGAGSGSSEQNGGTLPDPLVALYRGRDYVIDQDNISRANLNSQVVYTVTSGYAGAYTIFVDGKGGRGSYTLAVSSLGADDFGQSYESKVTVSRQGVQGQVDWTAGRINFSGDRDFIGVRGCDFHQGGRYRIELRSDELDLDQIRVRGRQRSGLFIDGDPDPAYELQHREFDYSEGARQPHRRPLPRISKVGDTAAYHVAPYLSCGFVIEVWSTVAANLGAYKLRVLRDPLPWNGSSEIGHDDLEDSAETRAAIAGLTAAPESYEGRYHFIGDDDWYAVAVESGKTYTFNASSNGSDLVLNLYDADGGLISRAQGGTSAGLVHRHSADAGTVYISVTHGAVTSDGSIEASTVFGHHYTLTAQAEATTPAEE